jgi:hypothetical protein
MRRQVNVEQEIKVTLILHATLAPAFGEPLSLCAFSVHPSRDGLSQTVAQILRFTFVRPADKHVNMRCFGGDGVKSTLLELRICLQLINQQALSLLIEVSRRNLHLALISPGKAFVQRLQSFFRMDETFAAVGKPRAVRVIREEEAGHLSAAPAGC